MDQVHVARIAFRIERALHHERPTVLAMRKYRSLAAQRESELQFGAPTVRRGFLSVIGYSGHAQIIRDFALSVHTVK
jgi:hypothetical protein